MASLLVASAALAQVTPGPEHEKFKDLEGTWDATMSMQGMESTGTMTWKVDLGGLWLVSEFKGEFAGMEFSGRGLDSYDPVKKKYVGIWVDSMTTSPMITEGNYDDSGNILTMTGEGPGMDGQPTDYKLTTERKDKDTLLWTMWGEGPDGQEEAQFTITYKRRK
jgi:hypothetical protein